VTGDPASPDGRRPFADAPLVGPLFFLASADAGFITGQTLNVDGGAFMN
jgi:NAD(P)-dependent dehydrogenase (short-subunit alcohol dehydrogenase family)